MLTSIICSISKAVVAPINYILFCWVLGLGASILKKHIQVLSEKLKAPVLCESQYNVELTLNMTSCWGGVTMCVYIYTYTHNPYSA